MISFNVSPNCHGVRVLDVFVLVVAFLLASSQVALAQSAGAAVDQRGALSKRFPEVAEMLDKAVADGEAAGVVHVIGQAGEAEPSAGNTELTHTHAVGVVDVEDGEAFSADTLVRIYSMTKRSRRWRP